MQQPNFTELSFEVPGLHHILATSRIEHHFLNGEPVLGVALDQISDLPPPTRMYLIHETQSPQAQVAYAGKPFEIIFSTSITHSQSIIEGVDIRPRTLFT